MMLNVRIQSVVSLRDLFHFRCQFRDIWKNVYENEDMILLLHSRMLVKAGLDEYLLFRFTKRVMAIHTLNSFALKSII